MRTFDPKEKKGYRDGNDRHYDRSESSSNRDDSRSFKKHDSASPFARDKRPRTTRPESTRSNDAPRQDGSQERRSFNPNFTKDNRKKDSDRPSQPWKKDGDRPARPWNKDGDKPSQPWKKDGDRSARPWNKDGERPSQPWKKDGDRPARPWNKDGDRPSQPWKSGGKQGYKKRDQAPAYNKDNYPKFAPPRVTGAVRLNRFIANSGICSRREADELIGAGVVTVNGIIITELGSKVMSTDEVRFNGEIIKGEPKVYIIMNKPKGFVTTLDDPHADKTVIDLIKGICKERVYPVGRLDKNSVGVLLITNDGELTRQLTHPSYNKRKIYQVTLDKALTTADMDQIARGIDLEDGHIVADEISYVGESRKDVGIEIHSGKNRIVRRIFESLGYSVQKLDRVYFAGLTKKRLKRGAWRFLTPLEVSRLKSGEYE